MRKFTVERDLPGIGNAEADQLEAAARKSNEILRELGPDIQWVQSFIAGEKTFSIYLAKDEAVIRRYSEMSGFTADRITEIGKIIDPTTARS